MANYSLEDEIRERLDGRHYIECFKFCPQAIGKMRNKIKEGLASSSNISFLFVAYGDWRIFDNVDVSFSKGMLVEYSETTEEFYYELNLQGFDLPFDVVLEPLELSSKIKILLYNNY